MNRRGFVGAALAGLGGFLFPQKLEMPDNFIIEELTDSTESRCRIQNGFRDKGWFIGKGKNVHNGAIIEMYPFTTREKAFKIMQFRCNTRRYI